MRRTRFKPSQSQIIATGQAWQRHMSLTGELHPDAIAASEWARMHGVTPKVRGPNKVREEGDEEGLEGPVVRAVGQLLAVHPRVLWALRMNAGAASRQTKEGKYVPVWFHRWVRSPEPCRMVDFLGAVNAPHPNDEPVRILWPTVLAIECKRPGWTKPTDQREREQAAFLSLARKHGGIGMFCTDAAQVAAALA